MGDSLGRGNSHPMRSLASCTRTLLLLAVFGQKSRVEAQGYCRTALGSRPFPAFRNAHEGIRAPDLETVAWDMTLAQSLRRDSIVKGLIAVPGGDVILFPTRFDTHGVADSIRRRLAADSSLAIAASLQLAAMWEGEASGAAASLYHDWRLPPQAALTFLADPAFAFAARTEAVWALEPYWGTADFRRASAAALCSLAARVEGIVRLGTDSSYDILTPDEYEFFSEIMWALGKTQEDGGPSPKDVVALLPADNILTQWTKTWLDIN
jgi:hypothetical protein